MNSQGIVIKQYAGDWTTENDLKSPSVVFASGVLLTSWRWRTQGGLSRLELDALV
jgi:hypothetical protein